MRQVEEMWVVWLNAWQGWRERWDDRGDVTGETAMIVMLLGGAVIVGGAVIAALNGWVEELENTVLP